ncbi:MAG: hypothetical protein C0478_00240 [Planctomyces sp.]|nr:hypothetical protein [Planctomyces sp.]
MTMAFLFGCPCFAQAQIIQQPSVGNTTAGTSVSVPDGGRTLIGGTSRGLTTINPRSTFPLGRGPVSRNPLFGGPSYGRSLSGGSMSASVHIIDLHEMDRQILGSAPDYPAAESAELPLPPAPKYTANDYLRKAEEAEAKGKPKVAEIYRRLAEKQQVKE